MTVTRTDYPQVALPPGADPDVEDWQPNIDGQLDYRLVWSTPLPLSDRLDENHLRCVVTQLVDGTIITSGDDEPMIYYGGVDFTLPEARTLAQGLLASADLLDVWTGGAGAIESRLAAIKSAITSVHRLLRVSAACASNDDQFGDFSMAASYVQTALDSISDTLEVLR